MRLNFVLPDFTRLMWVSQEERAVWEPKIQRVIREWERVERKSVADGIRNGAIQSVPVSILPEMQGFSVANNLALYVMGIHGDTPIYSQVPKEGNSTVRFALLHPDLVKKFHSANLEQDNLEIGRILGYPECCSKFFQKYWVEERWVDTTLPMAQGQQHFSVPPENNILLRWLGVRLVPHLPCSFNCQWTRAFALQLESLWNQEILHDAKEMLSWPIEWSALHGIAEIKTPVLKIGTRTDATAGKHIVTINTKEADCDLFLLNGFKDAQGMETAHSVLLASALTLKGIDSVLDLGCGNGYFLDKLRILTEPKVTTGIDIDPDAISFGRENFPELTLACEDIFKLPDNGVMHYDLAILMPGRLDEQQDLERRERLTRWLKATASYLLLYGYDDWSWLIPRLTDRFFGYTWDRVSSIESKRATTVLLRAR